MTTSSLKYPSAADSALNARATVLTILVVAADEPLRASIASALASQEYRLLDALDGAAALARVRRSEPDLIVLDRKLAEDPRASHLRGPVSASPGRWSEVVRPGRASSGS